MLPNLVLYFLIKFGTEGKKKRFSRAIYIWRDFLLSAGMAYETIEWYRIEPVNGDLTLEGTIAVPGSNPTTIVNISY